MSEEEIIKRIKYICDKWYDENLEIDVKWIQGLLDLYNKEKEKNKNSISKDKIKEKIEFYKRYGKIKNSNEYVMSVEIEVLKELSEE